MMILNKIKISGFRSLKETDWVNIFDLTAFIGENDGGKTAMTQAIRLLLTKNTRPDSADYTWESPDKGERVNQLIIEGLFTPTNLEKEKLHSYFNEVIDHLHIKKTFKSEGAQEVKIIKEVSIYEDFRIDISKLTIEDLKSLSKKYAIELGKTSKKPDIILIINEWLHNQPKQVGETDYPMQLFDLLPRIEYFSSSNSLNPEETTNNVLKFLCKNEINSGKYQGQIKEIEEGVRQVLADKVEELTPHIKKYYDEVDGVYIDPEFNISSGLGFVPLQLFKAGGGPIELQKKGDGKKRQVALAIYEWSTEALRAISSSSIMLDTDCKTGSTKRSFTEEQLIRDGFNIEQQVVFIGKNEFEDSFKDHLFKRIGDAFYQIEKGTWDEEVFKNFRSDGKFSEKLQSVFRDSKPEIGYKLGKIITKIDDIPSEILDVFTKANSLANMT